jgi:hypothetical protein
MTLIATPFVPAESDASDRSAAVPARSGSQPPHKGTLQGLVFSQALSKLKPAGDVVKVHPGDSLSGLGQKRLQDTNFPKQRSSEQLYRMVLKVATDNGISNPNVIHADQRINLSFAQPFAIAEALNPDASVKP